MKINADIKYIKSCKKEELTPRFAKVNLALKSGTARLKKKMAKLVILVGEDESVISTNIIRNEEISDQSSSVSVPEASIHILPTQNEGETDTLGQDEPNSDPATQLTCNQSPSSANQRTDNQSPAAATQRTVNQSSATVITRRTSNQSSKSTPTATVTLPKSTKKWKQSSMIKDKTKKEKVNAPSDENNTNQK